jgi:FAR1 DNA-binding domain-containing protein
LNICIDDCNEVIEASEANKQKCATDLSNVDIFSSLEDITAKTIEELEQLYTSHAQVTGFGIKKYTQRTTKDVVVERYYVCSCQGKKNEVRSNETPADQQKSKKIKLTPMTRYDCKARIQIKLDHGSGLYYIKQHIILHTHELTRVEWQHLHRSERQVSVAEKIDTIKSFEEASIRPTAAYRYLSQDAGGDEYVGHTLLDHINYVNR